jgi:hypothetical protein
VAPADIGQCLAGLPPGFSLSNLATITAMIVKALLERDASGGLALTRDGRAVLQALLAKRGQ